MPITLRQIPEISEGDVEMGAIDFTDWLESGELLTGSPTVDEVTTSDLTLANKAVSTAALTINGRTAAIGAAVQFSVTGQQADIGRYRLRVTVSTDASPLRTIVRDGTFVCK